VLTWQLLLDSIAHLLFPGICRYCHEMVADGKSPLCPTCWGQLDILSPEGRCPHCFGSDYHPQQRRCTTCRQEMRIFHSMAAVWDYQGPAMALISALKYGNEPYLAEGLGAFLASQWIQLGWDKPDWIVPMPISKARYLQRGYNQSALLAQSMGKLLDIPVVPAVRRRSGDPSQAGLQRSQRMELEASQFQLTCDPLLLNDRTILIVDDVITTGSSLRCCGEALAAGFPDKLYAITLCKA